LGVSQPLGSMALKTARRSLDRRAVCCLPFSRTDHALFQRYYVAIKEFLHILCFFTVS
jgi:hypothetical protein